MCDEGNHSVSWKPRSWGAVGIVVAQVPLAEKARLITHVGEQIGNRGGQLGAQQGSTTADIDGSVAGGIDARSASWPRVGVHIGADVEIGEPERSASASWSRCGVLEYGISVTGQVPVALVIGDDDNRHWAFSAAVVIEVDGKSVRLSKRAAEGGSGWISSRGWRGARFSGKEAPRSVGYEGFANPGGLEYRS